MKTVFDKKWKNGKVNFKIINFKDDWDKRCFGFCDFGKGCCAEGDYFNIDFVVGYTNICFKRCFFVPGAMKERINEIERLLDALFTEHLKEIPSGEVIEKMAYEIWNSGRNGIR